jgi:hypothetical protein
MDYHDGDGQNLINRWYESQDDKVKAHFHYVLNEVAVTRELDDSPSFNRLKYRHILSGHPKPANDGHLKTGQR